MSHNTAQPDRSLGELFGDLAREMSTLVRKELQLAKTEVSATASAVGKDVAFIAAGGFIAYAGFLALLATLVIILHTAGLPLWLAALLITVIVLGAGGILIMQGINKLKKTQMMPQQTMQTLKEDQQFIKEQVR